MIKGKSRFRKNFYVISILVFSVLIIFSGFLVAANKKSPSNLILPIIQEFDQVSEANESIILQNLNNPTEMENLILSNLLNQYDLYNLVGVTYSVVKDGSLFISNGFGVSNYLTLTPVNPNNTLFRVGSISKTFVAISILQLVEDGVIDLDTDVNNYLTNFKITNTYEEPITIRNLLTHTAGFEETVFQSVYENYSEMPDLEETLLMDPPARVNPPGEVVSYSNYGYCLLGYIIEELTGLPFEQYVQIEILDPFGMNHTTFEQPLPSQLESDMALGYWENREEGFFEYLSISPAASLTSSAGDMAKFMIAMLNNATFNGNQILENDTVVMMQSEQFTTHPDLPGMCFGLYEMNMNDQHIIGHGGDTVFFHSTMALFPEYNMGVFISYNNREGSSAKEDFFHQFIEYYFPYHNNNIVPMKDYTKDLDKFSGLYLASRRHYSNALGIPKDYWIRTSGITVFSTDKYLKLFGASLEFVQISPGYFVERSGDYDYIIIFFKDEKGRVTHFHSNIVGPTWTFEKVHYIYRNLEDFNAIVIVLSVIYGLSLVYWASKGFYDFIKKSRSIRSVDTLIKWWSIGVPATIIPYAYFINKRAEDIIFLEKEVPEIFGSTYILLIFTIIFTLGQLILATISWLEFKPSSLKLTSENQNNKLDEKNEEEELDEDIIVAEEETDETNSKRTMKILKSFQPLFKRLHYSILVILSVALVFIFGFWNLFSFF